MQEELTDVKVVEDMNVLTQSYLAKIEKSSANDVRLAGWNWRQILGIAASDVLGGMAGAYYFGWVGALIGGAAASVKAAVESGPNGILMPKDPNYTYATSNPNNPYDAIGLNHYLTVNQALSSASNYADSNENFSSANFYNFSTQYLTSVSVVTAQDLNAYTIQNHGVVLSDYPQFDSNYAKYLYNNNTVSLEVKDIVEDYYTALENSQDVDSFIAYSIQAENLVVSSTLNVIDKENILIMMATGRYGVHYWSH